MREADIRPPDILSEYRRLSAADAARLFANASALAARDCPGCGAGASTSAFDKNGFSLVTCDSCRTLYVSPAPKPEPLAALYRSSPSSQYWAHVFFPTVAEPRRVKIFRPRAERLFELVSGLSGSPRSVIDVGAGAGIFLDEFRHLAPAARLIAIEPGEDLARQCRNRSLEVFEGFADQAAQAGLGDLADLVTSFEVVEHVLDAALFLSAMARLAKPGGTIVVSGLCGDGFDIQVLGRRANAVFPPHHLNFLSRTGVERLVERCELELIDFLTPGKLDVDIVCNALAGDPEAVADPNLRERLMQANPEQRSAMQNQLVAEKRSSHMWIIARRPRA